MKALLTLVLSTLFTNARGEEFSQDWPPANYVHVVAYVYDYTQDSRGGAPAFPDGSLNKGIIRSATVRLTGDQTKTLVNAISQPTEFHESEDCIYPHHAFVFYDANWKPVSWFLVCWECGTYAASSKNFPDYIDLKPIRTLTKELGLPVLFEQEAYTELFLREQSPDDRKQILQKRAEEEAARIKRQKEDEMNEPDPFAPDNEEAEQAGTGQPATRPESKPKGGQKPEPEAEGRSR
jgi:hypothetical protein